VFNQKIDRFINCKEGFFWMVGQSVEIIIIRISILTSKLWKITVMTPEKAFDFFDELMQSVEWEKYQVLKKYFEELCKI
jgi:hypothetical protein